VKVRDGDTPNARYIRANPGHSPRADAFNIMIAAFLGQQGVADLVLRAAPKPREGFPVTPEQLLMAHAFGFAAALLKSTPEDVREHLLWHMREDAKDAARKAGCLHEDDAEPSEFVPELA